MKARAAIAAAALAAGLAGLEARGAETVRVDAPDHMLAYRGVEALRAGKRAVVRAPGARTLGEARVLLAEAGKRPGMLAIAGLGEMAAEDAKAVAEAGALGKVKRVTVKASAAGMKHLGAERPPAAQQAPKWWREWVGVMPLRPYYALYVEDEGWRAFLDFGTGPLGRDGVRLMRAVFAAVKPGEPLWAERTRVGGESAERETYPKSARVRFGFAGGFELVWEHSEGGEEKVVWEGEKGRMETKPPRAGGEGREEFCVPAEAAGLLKTVFLGCAAMMNEGRVTEEACEQPYARDGWEWMGENSQQPMGANGSGGRGKTKMADGEVGL